MKDRVEFILLANAHKWFNLEMNMNVASTTASYGYQYHKAGPSPFINIVVEFKYGKPLGEWKWFGRKKLFQKVSLQLSIS